jgi:hypothetical protein
MQLVQDPFETGSVVAAALAPAALSEFEPVLRRLLAGTQLFVKLPDGRYRPRGCALGLAQCFEFSDFVTAEERAP